MSSAQVIEKIMQASKLEKNGNKRAARKIYEDIRLELNDPIWIRMKISRLNDEKSLVSQVTLPEIHEENVSEEIGESEVTNLSGEISHQISDDFGEIFFDSKNCSWKDWDVEFGPGNYSVVENGIKLESIDNRYFISKKFEFRDGYQYQIQILLNDVNCKSGCLAALVNCKGIAGDFEFLSLDFEQGKPINLQIRAEKNATANLRIGIGTTANTSGHSNVTVSGLRIYEAEIPKSNSSFITNFAAEYIDPELILPDLEPSGNNHQVILNDVAKVKKDKKFKFTKKISIIIPAYERMSLLRKTLSSIECQDYPKELLEVIIIDDGSLVDNFEEIFSEFSNKINLFLARQNRNGYGLSRARNLGARSSNGEVLFFLDSDLLLPKKYISSVMIFHHVSNICSVLGIRKFVNSDSISVEDIKNPQLDFDSLEKCQSANPHHKEHLDESGNSIDWRIADFNKNNWLNDSINPFRYFGGGHASVTRDRYFLAGGYDENFDEWGNEDQEFAYRLYSIGQKFIPLRGIYDYHQEEPQKKLNQSYKLVENKRTNEMLIDRCPHFKVRPFDLNNRGYLVPLFSIYIPAFNSEKYIKECIESVLSQSFQDFELIIVNDGSTDNTHHILNGFTDNKLIKIITTENKGIGHASNMGVSSSRGEFIVQLDSDDTLEPNALLELANFLSKNPTFECIYTNHNLINENGELIGAGWSPNYFDRYENLVGMCVPHLRAFRRSLYHKTIGFNENILNAVDYDFFLKISNLVTINHLDLSLYNYRIHRSQTSNKSRTLQVKNHVFVINNYLSSVGRGNFYGVNLDPSNPQKNYILRKGSYFERRLLNRKFIPKLPPELCVIKPKCLGNDYSFIQEYVNDFYKKNSKNYFEKVSIVVPVYNRSERLSRCLAGIFQQTYPKDLIEILVVDDGSSDDVMKIINKYQKLLNLKYVKQHDSGYRLSAARNLGIRSSSYRNIAIIDCDLIPLPNFIESFMQYLHHFDNVVLLGHQRFVDPTGISDDDILRDVNNLNKFKDIKSENSTMLDGSDGITRDWRYQLYNETNYLKNDEYPYRAFSSGHVAYRKKVIVDAGYYDEDFNVWGCEDNEAGYRIYQKGYFFIPVLDAIDLHQEPPSGKNETDREADRIISRKLLQEKLPAMRGWFGEPYNIKPGDAPLFSVCIPMHNTGSYVIDAIESVLSQTMQDFEVLIYDDASNDDTLELVKERYANNPKVRIIEGAVNKHVTHSRYVLLKNALGEFAAFLDSDDLLYPEALASSLKLFRGRPDIGLICTSYDRIDENGTFIDKGWIPDNFDRNYLFVGNIFTHMRVLRIRDWNRSKKWNLKELSTYKYGEDWDLCIKLAEVANFDRTTDILYRYRVRSKGITNTVDVNFKWEQTKEVASKALERSGFHHFEVVHYDKANPHAIGYVKIL